MLLAIDIGNTNITYGLFEGKKLVKVWRQETGDVLRVCHPEPFARCHSERSEESDCVFAQGKLREGSAMVYPSRPFVPTKVGTQGDINGIIISSVVPKLDRPLARAIEKRFKHKPVFATYKNIGLKIHLKNKAQVGADRLVNAYAVNKLFGGPAIIVDFGTATTFCAINKKGEYLGGAIAPGIRLSAEALHYKTAKLPLIDFSMAKQKIGKDTRNAMLSGLYFGYISLVEGMVSRFKKELGPKTRVIATGGFSRVIGKKTRVFDIIDPDLTLKGLRLVYVTLSGAKGLPGYKPR